MLSVCGFCKVGSPKKKLQEYLPGEKLITKQSVSKNYAFLLCYSNGAPSGDWFSFVILVTQLAADSQPYIDWGPCRRAQPRGHPGTTFLLLSYHSLWCVCVRVHKSSCQDNSEPSLDLVMRNAVLWAQNNITAPSKYGFLQPQATSLG